VETLLMVTIDAARRGGMLKASSTDKIIVDTTVMPKAIAHPTDSRLLEKSRQHLVKLAEDNGIDLRQNYNRKLHQLPVNKQPQAQDLLGRVSRILTQKTQDKNKLYALHAPEVECISKGKARTPYEFGVKVTVATTLKEGLVVGMRSMPGNPWDGHTLDETIEQVSILTNIKPKTVIVDKGYQGVKIEGIEILRSGQRRVTRAMKAMIKRRSAIEPAIGHMKMDGKLSRNPLKGALGDALHAVMCGAGHNMRMLLRKLRLLCTQFGLALQEVLQVISLPRRTNYGVVV
jgi:IS5 family transposase